MARHPVLQNVATFARRDQLHDQQLRLAIRAREGQDTGLPHVTLRGQPNLLLGEQKHLHTPTVRYCMSL
jgi:hypothetical protein